MKRYRSLCLVFHVYSKCSLDSVLGTLSKEQYHN